jgi:DNA mismatch repair protein MutL
MALIHVLDEVTANQIAAGEVVERPVNAVKELVENSIDASAHEVEVEIADGGITYIRVTDDGTGMTGEDARLSIVRHATSKISSVDNIYHIASLGFRGEALPSIMSVARGRITTRRPEDDMGTIIDMEGGEVISAEEAGAPAGTTVEVRDLFYNVPARKKFLKSERTESSRINTMVGKLALANPDVAFRLINNGRTVIETPGSGRLLDVISALYGLDTAGEMLEVNGEGEQASLTGMVSKPSLLKSSRSYQTIIVNRRVVENSAITKAVDNAYHSLLPKNGHPIMVLSLVVPPESIDVNVHPQKREIKFSREQDIFRLVYHAVLEALTTAASPEQLATEMIRNPGHDVLQAGDDKNIKTLPLQSEGEGSQVMEGSSRGWGAPSGNFQPSPAPSGSSHSGSSLWKTEYKPNFSEGEDIMHARFLPEKDEESQEEPVVSPLFDAPEPDEREQLVIPLGQIDNCFIVCSHGHDLYIIDQHAAHERIRYDHLAERAEGIPVQQLLVPLLVQVGEEDLALLMDRKDEVECLGITFEQAGPDVIRVTGAPEDLPGEDVERAIRDTLVAFHEKDVPSPETLRHRMMAYAACRGAIKRGDPLNIRQMKELIADLFKTSRPFVCPHGRPTIVRFTPVELGRLFHRT